MTGGRRGRADGPRLSGGDRGDEARVHHTPGSRPPDVSVLLELSVLALIAAATSPFAQVFVTGAWIRPTAGAVLVALGVAAVTRRARLRPSVSLLVQLVALVLYLGVVFVPWTMLTGVVPTPATLAGLWSLAVEGLRIIPERASPTVVVPPLALLAVAGTGAIALIADLLVHAGRAPLKAAIVALTLWAVPLSMSPPRQTAWIFAVPVLTAIAFLLLAFAAADASRWGRWVHPRDRRHMASGGPIGAGGMVASLSAVGAGVLLAGSLPGFGEPAWWQLRAEGGSTLTANPIVQLRSNLVASGTQPIFTVRTPRPVYLRTTALDEYGELEEWTTSGIRTRPLRDGRMARGTVPDAFEVDVTVGDITRADLVPMPYQPLQVTGEVSEAFQFDPRTGTVALDVGAALGTDDSYSVVTAVPSPTAAQLEAAGERLPDDPLTALPDNVAPEVAGLARTLVDRAGATTPFAQALAIQNELRSWQYSLDPPAGHDGSAMMRFLENRVGYCEQFAGTMAVMLRTLDVPARVAVGFTPGRLVEEGSDTYAVSWSNAHAWVEVLFPEIGWIAFEPTPRGDGNVLVPSVGNPAPATLQQDPVALGSGAASPYGDVGALAQPGDDLRSAADLPRGQVTGVGGTGVGDRTGSPLAAVVAVTALLVVVGGALAWRRWTVGTSPDAPPVERVLAAGRRVGRVGAGLRVPPRPTETDREYLRRLVVGTRVHQPARVLAHALTRARYAPSVDVDDAARAERAATELIDELVGSLSRRRRIGIAVRGVGAEVGALAGRALRQFGREGRRRRAEA